MFVYDDRLDFNRYVNLDTLEGRIAYILVNSRSAHALDLWNMLEYNTSDCLMHIDDYFRQPEIQAQLLDTEQLTLLTTQSDFAKMPPSRRQVCQKIWEEAWKAEIKKRWHMIYTENDEASGKKVFFYPFIDDAWTERSARLDIYVDDIEPTNQLTSIVLVGIDIIVHNKIVNIDNPFFSGNPADYDEDKINNNEISLTKSRVSSMLKSVLAELNGAFVAGVGLMHVNQLMNKKCGAKRMTWNNRSYIGHQIIFGAEISGVSDNPNQGF